MIRHRLLVIGAVLVVTTVCVRGFQTPPRDQTLPAQPKGTAVIRGRVVAEGTNTPVARVDVTAFPSGAFMAPPTEATPPRWTATTDEAGAFEIKAMPAGRYILVARVPHERPQYLSTLHGARSAFDRGKPIDVADGALIDDIVVQIRRSGVVNGRVINEFGDPVAFARVNALLVRAPGAEPTGVGPWRETDDLGRFRVFGLQPGQYVISVEPSEWDPSPTENRLRYVKMFYPGVLSIEEAQPVTVDAGQEPSDIEIVLRRARTYRISGIVVSPSGQSGSAQISYSHQKGNMSGIGAKPDGTFTIGGLAPGEYTVVATTAYSRETDAQPEMSAPVTVQLDQDVDGLSLVMKRGARISGHVVLDLRDEKRPPSMRVSARPRTFRSVMGIPVSALVKPDGTFTMSGMFGSLILRVDEVGGRYNQSVVYKGKDITETFLEFEDIRDSKELEIVVTDKGAQIAGQVTDSKGVPVTEGIVMAFSADERRWGSWSQANRMGSINARGMFRIEPLKPGKYLMVATDMQSVVAARSGPDNEAAFYTKLAAIATPVEILENETREVSLTVSKLPQ